MSNPFTIPFTCAGCCAEGVQIDMFPGSLCIECHAARFDSQPPMDVQATLAKGVRA